MLTHIVIFRARSRITLLPGMNTDGQQHTYILILRARYSNSWVDLTKVFNRIWNGPSTTINMALGIKFEHDGGNAKTSQEELEKVWREQTHYATDVEGRKIALAAVMVREDSLLKFPNREGEMLRE